MKFHSWRIKAKWILSFTIKGQGNKGKATKTTVAHLYEVGETPPGIHLTRPWIFHVHVANKSIWKTNEGPLLSLWPAASFIVLSLAFFAYVAECCVAQHGHCLTQEHRFYISVCVNVGPVCKAGA